MFVELLERGRAMYMAAPSEFNLGEEVLAWGVAELGRGEESKQTGEATKYK